MLAYSCKETKKERKGNLEGRPPLSLEEGKAMNFFLEKIIPLLREMAMCPKWAAKRKIGMGTLWWPGRSLPPKEDENSEETPPSAILKSIWSGGWGVRPSLNKAHAQ